MIPRPHARLQRRRHPHPCARFRQPRPWTRCSGTACATGTPSAAHPGLRDGDGDTFADCDSGAVERGQVPENRSLNRTRLDCRTAACRVPVTCNLTSPVHQRDRTVRALPRASTAAQAAERIRFACLWCRQLPARRYRDGDLEAHQAGQATCVRTTKKRQLKGVLGIKEVTVTVSNAPITSSRTGVTIRLSGGNGDRQAADSPARQSLSGSVSGGADPG